MQTKQFKVGQYVQSAGARLMNEKGDVYLEPGEIARVMVFDPSGHEDAPYGLRKEQNAVTGTPAEHITKNYFSAAQLDASPIHPVKGDIWTDHPEEYYSHPANPRYEELRHSNWRVDPTE